MSTPTNKNAVLIPEASSGIGLDVAARGSAVSTVATQPTFGAGEPAIARLSRNGSLNQGLDSEAAWPGGGGVEERIAILYENRQWMEGLFRELESRGLFLRAPTAFALAIAQGPYAPPGAGLSYLGGSAIGA